MTQSTVLHTEKEKEKDRYTQTICKEVVIIPELIRIEKMYNAFQPVSLPHCFRLFLTFSL